MTQTAKPLEREWSHQILVDEISSNGKTYTLSPDESARQAIAKRLQLVSLDDLKARLTIGRDNAHVIQVKGEFEAEITQSCVVTLEPVKTSLMDSFDAWYADHEKAVSFKRAQHEALLKKDMVDLPILEEEEDPEPIEDGKIDLGELVTQYLSLAIPPYPHKEGIDYENKEVLRTAPAKESLRPNPFAALKNWRPKD